MTRPRTPRPSARMAAILAATEGSLHHVFRCAHAVADAVDRRMPEAAAVAGWLDQDRAALGLPDGADFGAGEERRATVPAPAWSRLRQAVARGLAANPELPHTPAAQWLAVLGDRLALDPGERRLLCLVLHYGIDDRLEHLVDRVAAARGGLADLRCDAGLLALLLADDPAAVEARLRPDGPLRASGVLHVGGNNRLSVMYQLATLARGGVRPGADPLGQLLGPALPPGLPWDAFAHLGEGAEIAAALLAAAVTGNEAGVNILLYGPPGTGKTSFAATLAHRAGAGLRPVTEQDDTGNEPDRFDRLAGLQLAQRLAPPGQTVLLFDEAEDVFVRRSGSGSNRNPASRVFMHRLLEHNALPVVWTANDIGALGPAVLRRMTMCLEFGVPGVAVRTRLWRRMGDTEGVALAEAEAARLAHLVPAAPALAATAMRATRLAGGGAGTAHLIVEGIARAVAGGRAPLPQTDPAATYDPALVNADTDLLALADSLARPGAPRNVSLLLSGPPGTGKSAWVRHLATRMGLEVVQKRASDLLGMFVGETEARIAAAFAEAREANAFLVFDEADSLLGDREGAIRSWEVSQVNEMLTWMESHPLPFACTTNLPGRLDNASLRRFLVKLKLGWLSPTQARLAFQQFFGTAAPGALDGLHTLTPADFALVRRRAALLGMPGPGALVDLLAAEADGRTGGRGPVGFGRGSKA